MAKIAQPPRVHAIYVVLNDVELFTASLKAIYESVSGVTVVTAYDQDWFGERRETDDLVARILDRSLDPDGKISLIVTRDPNQARTLNRAMDHAAPPRKSQRVLTQHSLDLPLEPIDYFWIIDSDEIYERSTIPRLFEYISRGRRIYQVAGHHYFKTWSYRVDPPEWFTAFVRSDVRLGTQRNVYPGIKSKLLWRAPLFSDHFRLHLLGVERVPLEVAAFHHGSYVGPRERIATKIRSSPHAHQIRPHWMEEVWETWSETSRDFHPTDPRAFTQATPLSFDDLPEEIRSRDWPEGYVGLIQDGD